MWELPLPDGCHPRDWAGCTNVALRAAIAHVPPDVFHRHLLAFMADTLTTSNQRQLFSAVLMRCADEARLHREPWDTLALSISSQTPYQMQTAPPSPRGGWRCAIVS